MLEQMDVQTYPQVLPPLLLMDIAAKTIFRDWEISVFVDPHEGPVLWIKAEVNDAYNPGEKITLGIRSNIPPPCMWTVFAFKEYILWRLMQIDIHETREDLQFDGVRYRDPHDPLEPK